MLPPSTQQNSLLKNIHQTTLSPNKIPNNTLKIKNSVFLLTKKLKINTHRSYFSMDNSYINFDEQTIADKETIREKYTPLEKESKNNYNTEENNEKFFAKTLSNFKDIFNRAKKRDNELQKTTSIINYKKYSGNILYKKKKYTYLKKSINTPKIIEDTDINFRKTTSYFMTNKLNPDNYNIIINKEKFLTKKNINSIKNKNNKNNNNSIANNIKNKSQIIDFSNNTTSSVYKTIMVIRDRNSKKNLLKKNQNNKLAIKKFCDIIKNIFAKNYKNSAIIFFEIFKDFKCQYNSKMTDGENSNIRNISTPFISMNTSLSSIKTNNTERLRDKIIYNNKKKLTNQSFQKQNFNTVLKEMKHSESNQHIIRVNRLNKNFSGNENKLKSLKKMKKKNITNILDKDKNNTFLETERNKKLNIPSLIQNYSKNQNSKLKKETNLLFIKQNTINTKDNKLIIDVKFVAVKSVISKMKSDFKKYEICNKISIFYYKDKVIQLTDRNLCTSIIDDYLSVIKEESEVLNGTSGYKKSMFNNKSSNIIIKVGKDIDIECSPFNKKNN